MLQADKYWFFLVGCVEERWERHKTNGTCWLRKGKGGASLGAAIFPEATQDGSHWPPARGLQEEGDGEGMGLRGSVWRQPPRGEQWLCGVGDSPGMQRKS